ncbi:MAG: response regulator transcription factor [Bacteroidota bacterium]|nr:response regulator transcription factor [Bacteroidota bacterium]
MLKILIADDHAIVRKGLIGLLREAFFSAEIHEVSDGIDAIEKVRKDKWDLILLDISIPGKNGIEVLKQLRTEGVKTPILILSIFPEDQYAIRVLKAGASGFVNKDCATEGLIEAVHKVLSGRKYVSAAIAQKLAETMNDNGSKLTHEQLSDREMQVLQLIASGKTVSDIAELISLSINTISTYRARLLEKLSLHNNAELTRYAFDNGLI